MFGAWKNKRGLDYIANGPTASSTSKRRRHTSKREKAAHTSISTRSVMGLARHDLVHLVFGFRPGLQILPGPVEMATRVCNLA